MPFQFNRLASGDYTQRPRAAHFTALVIIIVQLHPHSGFDCYFVWVCVKYCVAVALVLLKSSGFEVQKGRELKNTTIGHTMRTQSSSFSVREYRLRSVNNCTKVVGGFLLNTIRFVTLSILKTQFV